VYAGRGGAPEIAATISMKHLQAARNQQHRNCTGDYPPAARDVDALMTAGPVAARAAARTAPHSLGAANTMPGYASESVRACRTAALLQDSRVHAQR